MTFQFRLQAVLRIRQHNRDMEHQAVTAARVIYEEKVAERDRLAKARTGVLTELRGLNDSDLLDLEKVTQWQRYAEELRRALMAAESVVGEVADNLEKARQRLITADQSAQLLEQLAERQFDEFQTIQHKRDEREIEDFIHANRRIT